MTETGWQAIGRIAKARRERLGMNQDELARYGGPRVATVGKFERAAQATFPLRTQHQIENALGWSRGTVEQVVRSIDDGTLEASGWEHDLIEEDVPDLSRQAAPVDVDDDVVRPIEAFGQVFRLIDPLHRQEALREALLAVLPFLGARGAEELGRGLRAAFPPGGGDGHADDTRGAAPMRLLSEHEVDRAAYDPDQSTED